MSTSKEGLVIEHVRIEWIRIEGRHRKDLGDLETLARSMKEHGLINPVTITPLGRLLAGGRRIEAARMLGWTHIKAHVVDTFDDATRALLIERDENTERKEMTASELVALGSALEAMESPTRKAATSQRLSSAALRREARKRGEDIDSPNSASIEAELGTSMNADVAAALGVSKPNYERMKVIVGAATDLARTPEERSRAASALADLDAGKESVHSAYERVRGTRRGPAPRIRTTIDKPAAQRRAIGSAEAALSGFAHALRQIETLHEEITSEEAARWADSLSESRRAITVLINLLKERSSGNT